MNPKSMARRERGKWRVASIERKNGRVKLIERRLIERQLTDQKATDQKATKKDDLS